MDSSLTFHIANFFFITAQTEGARAVSARKLLRHACPNLCKGCECAKLLNFAEIRCARNWVVDAVDLLQRPIKNAVRCRISSLRSAAMLSQLRMRARNVATR